MFGMNNYKRKIALKKIENHKLFLDNNFVKLGSSDMIPLSDFTKNAYINSNRYIAELQNRAWSIFEYAQSKNLVNVFVTLTLPSEYHPFKTLQNGKKIKNKSFIDDEAHNPKNATKELSKMLKKVFDSRIYKTIPKDLRCYFRVTEPHKSGVPHLHISFFIPQDRVEKFKNMIHKKFVHTQHKVESNIHNPVSYLMKYILKTLDDLRGQSEKLTDLSLWYVYWGICRFYTSRTLINLDIYRKLGGKYTLLELTTSYKEKTLRVYLDPQSNKTIYIENDYGVLYFKQNIEVATKKDYKVLDKPILKQRKQHKIIKVYKNGLQVGIYKDNEYKNIPIIPKNLTDLQLQEYFTSLDIEDENLSLLHYGICQNEMIDRSLITDIEKQNLNYFTDSFFDEYGF